MKPVFKQNRSQPIICGIFASFGNSFYLASQYYTKVNLVSIKDGLNLSSSELSLYVNIQTIMLLIASSLTGKLAQMYPPARIFLGGQILCCVMDLLTFIPQLQQNYIVLVVLRGLAGFGIGLCTCQQNPLNKLFVSKDKLNTSISIAIMTGPILASIFSFISLSIDWYWMQGVEGIVALIFIIPQIFLWDYNLKIVKTKQRINVIAQILFAIGIAGTIYGLINLTNKSQLIISAIVLPIGIISLITFFIYDLAFAKVITFGKQMFNNVLIRCYGIMLLASLTFYGCQYFQSTIYDQIYELSHRTISIIQGSLILAMAISSISAGIAFKYVSTRSLWLFAYTLNLLSIIANSLLLVLGNDKKYLPGSIVFYTLEIIAYGINQDITFNYTFQIAPTYLGPSLGVLNQTFSYLGSTLGSTIAALLNEVYPNMGYIEMTISIAMILAIILSQWLRVYEFDKGKIGAKHVYSSTYVFQKQQQLNWEDVIQLC